MKLSKRFVVFAIFIAITLVWKLNNWNDRYAQVESFRGAALNEDVLYPLMSKNLNDSGQLKIYVNGQPYSNSQAYAMLDDGLNPVGSLEFIRSVLKGSAFMKDDSSAVVQITNDVYEFQEGEDKALSNGRSVDLLVKPSIHVGEMYVGLEDLCSTFGYKYTYDKESYTVKISYSSQPALPTKYDLRKVNRVSEIRNQGSTATCWACASLEAMESAMLPAKQYIFSVDAMINENSFGLDESEGGKYTMALAYLLAWQGPKLDKNAANQTLLGGLTESNQPQTIHLQEVHFYDSEDLDKIKLAVYQYGGVSSSIYASVSSSNLTKSTSYNRHTNAYCYRGNNRPNHDVVIIGWDDNYPAQNFSENVPGNGAFICQNSWGTGFGDDGVFYISYYDSNIGNQAVSYVKVDTNNTYNYIYQSDLCGFIGQIGYNQKWAYGANTFTASADQQIEAAGFYALGKDTAYKVYFVSNYENTSSFSEKELVASGTLEERGYYTISFNTPKTVKAGENFAILLYVNTPDTTKPLAVEYATGKMSKAVDITDGKSFYSNNGIDWENIEASAESNLCLKAYANNVMEVFE